MKEEFIDNIVEDCILCDNMRIGKFGWIKVDDVSKQTLYKHEYIDSKLCPECIEWMTPKGYGPINTYTE